MDAHVKLYHRRIARREWFRAWDNSPARTAYKKQWSSTPEQKELKRARTKTEKRWLMRPPGSRKAEYPAIKKRIALRKPLLDALKDYPCVDCGVKYPPYVMDFDHVRGPKSFSIGRLWRTTPWARVLAEIAKCDLVCANCHRERTHGGVDDV